MTHFQKRWVVAILYYADLICLDYLLIAHVLSFWSIAILGDMASANIGIAAFVIFIASIQHHLNMLYFANYGEKRPFLTDSFEIQRRSVLLLFDVLFKYRSTAPSVVPYAPIWLVRFSWAMRLLWLPYFLFTVWQMAVSSGITQEVGLARGGSIWLLIIFFYSLPILYSWHRELVIEPEG